MKFGPKLFLRTSVDRHKKLDDALDKASFFKRNKPNHSSDKKKDANDELEMIQKLMPSGTTSTAMLSSKDMMMLDDSSMPRISAALSLDELHKEALARGIDKQMIIPLGKSELLKLLVDGSIHLRQTPAWKNVERLRSKMEADCKRIASGGGAKNCDKTASTCSSSTQDKETFGFSTLLSEENENVLLRDPFATFSRPEIMTPELDLHIPTKETKWKTKGITQEQSLMDMTSLHTTWPSFYSTWPDPTFSFQTKSDSGFTRLLRMVPFPDMTMACGETLEKVLDSVEIKDTPLSTAEPRDNDDFGGDIINTRTTTTTTKSKKSTDGAATLRSTSKKIIAPSSMVLHEKQNWNAARHYESWIMHPPEKNRTPKGNQLKGFTVWCSISPSNLRSPEKLFDTTYKKMGDANDRARYLFYWKNPWRMSPQKMTEVVHIKSDNSSNTGCASTFHCVHPNAETWIVSIVNDATFQYLDNASTIRHNLDKDYSAVKAGS